jgi:hypothetical protein
LEDLERWKCQDLQQQIFIAIRSAAENQRRKQELDHGRAKHLAEISS